MTSAKTHDPTGAGLSNDLSGLEILFVEIPRLSEKR